MKPCKRRRASSWFVSLLVGGVQRGGNMHACSTTTKKTESKIDWYEDEEGKRLGAGLSQKIHIKPFFESSDASGGMGVRSLGLLRVCDIEGNLKFSIDTELIPPTGIPESLLATVPISWHRRKTGKRKSYIIIGGRNLQSAWVCHHFENPSPFCRTQTTT